MIKPWYAEKRSIRTLVTEFREREKASLRKMADALGYRSHASIKSLENGDIQRLKRQKAFAMLLDPYNSSRAERVISKLNRKATVNNRRAIGVWFEETEYGLEISCSKHDAAILVQKTLNTTSAGSSAVLIPLGEGDEDGDEVDVLIGRPLPLDLIIRVLFFIGPRSCNYTYLLHPTDYDEIIKEVTNG
jgi:hypothetical protein